MRRSNFYLAATFCLLVVGCGAPPAISTKTKPMVVASFTVLGDWVREVGGDTIEVVTLVGPGLDPHTFEPTAQQAVPIANAAVIFQIGLHFETWLDRLYQSSKSSGIRIVVSEGIQPIHADGTESREPDPHIWHDPSNARKAVKVIADALSRAFPDRAAVFQVNAARYQKDLDTLDQWIESEVQTIPVDHRKLVTSHDTFGYFARRYRFEVLESAFGSLSTEDADPSAKHISEVINHIRSVKVPSIFCENIQSPKLMERIASEAGVKLAPSLFTDALGESGSNGDSYLKMMRHNISTIVKALRP